MKYVGYTIRFGRGYELYVLNSQINSTSMVLGNYVFVFSGGSRDGVSAKAIRKFSCINFARD